MPAVLMEVSFISNPVEEGYLAKTDYRARVVTRSSTPSARTATEVAVFGWFFRRLVPMGPALLLFGVVLFALVASVPPPDLDAEGQAKRALHLPVLFNLDPEDRPRLVPALVERAASSTGETRERAVKALLRIGAAGLPELGPALERLSPGARGALAHELQPLAVRTGQIDASDLDDPKKGGELPPPPRRARRRSPPRVGQAHAAPPPRGARRAELPRRAARGRYRRHRADLRGARAEAHRGRPHAARVARRRRRQAGRLPAPRGSRAPPRLVVAPSRRVPRARPARAAGRPRDRHPPRSLRRGSRGHARPIAAGRQSRSAKICARAPKTIGRVLTALALAYLGGLPLAWLLTARRRQAPARVIGTASVVLYALPAFVLALAIRGASSAFARNEVFVAVALALVSLAPIWARDLPWIMPFVLALATFSAVLVLFADVLHGLVDPRVRASLVRDGGER
ncbi:MAG: hypothetical protein IPJ34_42980 [Myxococcales bacterium]|nr:hypothetical protein [Myxococcales bacterium]